MNVKDRIKYHRQRIAYHMSEINRLKASLRRPTPAESTLMVAALSNQESIQLRAVLGRALGNRNPGMWTGLTQFANAKKLGGRGWRQKTVVTYCFHAYPTLRPQILELAPKRYLPELEEGADG